MPLLECNKDSIRLALGDALLQDQTIGAVATGRPGAAALMRELGVRVCCLREATLAEVTEALGLPIGLVVETLEARARAVRRSAPDADGALIDFIVAEYHEGHRADLPGLIERARSVERSAAGRSDAPLGLSDELAALLAGLDEHMLKEELRLFPLMRAKRRDIVAGSLAMMRAEHEDNAAFLLRAEHLTRSYLAPADGGEDWRKLYADLLRFTENLVAHVFLEEDVLFPRYDSPLA